MGAVEWVAAALGLVSVWLNVREDWRGWPVGAVMVALYFAVFARVKLYADAGLQVIYLVLQFYGWHEWVRGGAGKSGVTVSRAPPFFFGPTSFKARHSVIDAQRPEWLAGAAGVELPHLE